MQTLKIRPIRLDAAPTEVQMKLAIAQVLSLPFAYNSPVIILDFEVGGGNVISGRFKDASRPRVFEFEIDDSISFKPFTWKRTDSANIDPMAWEDFSKGFGFRFDTVKKVRKEKPTCGNTSYNCGKACIGLNKNCKSDPPDKPSQEKIDKVKAMGGEFKKVQGDPVKRQEDNKLTPKPPEEVDSKNTIKATTKPEGTTKPDPTTSDYDNWLNTESKKLKGEKTSYDLAVKGGVEKTKGTDYDGLGVSKSIDKLTKQSKPKYAVTHIASGLRVGNFDDEDMAKKAVVELHAMGVDWKSKDLSGSSDKLANLNKTLNDVAVSHWRVLRESVQQEDTDPATDTGKQPTPEPTEQKQTLTPLRLALKIGKKSVNLTDDLDSYRDLKLTADPVLGWQVTNKNGEILREPPNGNMAPSHRFKKREQAEKFANDVMTRVEKLQKAQPKPEAVAVKPDDPKSTPEAKALLEAEESFNKTVKGKQILDQKEFDKRSEIKRKALVNYNARKAFDSPTQEQKDYDAQQPDLDLDSGAGMDEGWRSRGFEKYLKASPEKKGSVFYQDKTTGIPWTVTIPVAPKGYEQRIIVGAKLKDDFLDKRRRYVETIDTKGDIMLISFERGDTQKSVRAKRLIREIVQGKSQQTDPEEMKALIEGGRAGLEKLREKRKRIKEKVDRDFENWQNQKPEAVAVKPEVEAIAKPETPQQTERAKRSNGYLIPMAGDDVYSVTGGLIGSTKWKAKVLSVDPGGRTMSIEKGWEKTKSGKPSKMTVPINAWTVENDPQKQKDIDKNLAEKKEAETKANNLLKRSEDSVNNAIKSAVDSGTERIITKDDLKKGDTFYLYLKIDRTGDHIKQKYEYTSDTFAKEILPDGSKESETYVLSPDVKITAPVVSLANPTGAVKPETPPTAKSKKTPKAKVVKVEDNSPPRPKLKSKEHLVNQLYDDWLDAESQKNQGRDAQYQVKFASGDVSVQGRIYGNFGIHEDKTSKPSKYNITHLASGRMLNRLENEDQAKKAIIELDRSGIDWSLDEAELLKDPKMQGKMKTAKRLMDIAIESDTRVKEAKGFEEKRQKEADAIKNKVIPTDQEHRDKLMGYLENKLFDLNLKNEDHKKLLISKAIEGVRENKANDIDSYSANPGSLAVLVGAYLMDRPEPPKFEDYVKDEIPIEKSIKKLAAEAFWHFKDKKLTPNLSTTETISTPTEEPKPAKKLVGDGTHEGVPKDAEEYREMMAKNGTEITRKDSEQVIDSVTLWGRSAYSIRQKQQKGEFSQEAENIDTFIKNSTPYDGDVHRGLFFENREKALQWAKGDESGLLDNQSAHASWTSDLVVAKEFAQVHGSYSGNKDQQPIIVSARNKTGASIKPLAKFPGENEIVVSKGARHKVKSVTEKNGIIYVETEEI